MLPLPRNRGAGFCLQTVQKVVFCINGEGFCKSREGFPVMLVFFSAERWLSGLRRLLGEQVYGQPYREFESRPLRAAENELSGERGGIPQGIEGSNPSPSVLPFFPARRKEGQ